MTYPFNVRVYGLLIEKGHILLTDEERHGIRFTKFPGGGLQYGEGLIDGLKREFLEECATEIVVRGHFYTTDFFIKSAFDNSQVICVYYEVFPVKELQLSFRNGIGHCEDGCVQSFRWKDLNELSVDDVTFPSDKKVVELLGGLC